MEILEIDTNAKAGLLIYFYAAIEFVVKIKPKHAVTI